MKKKHILICGKRGAGKSTLIKKLLKEIYVPVSGFVTVAYPIDDNGAKAVYIYPASGPFDERSERNHLGNTGNRLRSINPHAFDDLGMELLQSPDSGIIVMDELGFMETCSDAFCGRVLELLERDIPVIAAVKARYDVDFLNEVRSKALAEVYHIDEKNRDMLYEKLLPVIKVWNYHC